MGYELLYDKDKNAGVFFCNTIDAAISTVIYSDKDALIDFNRWFFNKFGDMRKYDKYFIFDEFIYFIEKSSKYEY